MKRLSNLLLKIAKKLDPNVIPKAPEPLEFDCIKCHAHVVVPFSQEIKFRLCDPCFIEFDRQRRAGRLWMASSNKFVQPSFYTEDVREWLVHERG